MTDGIDLKSVQWHGTPDISDWPITLDLQGVEFKAGSASDGNTVGVRPIFDRGVMNQRWQPYRVWPNNPETGQPNPPNDGWIQHTLGAIVKVSGAWHGAALQEFWGNQYGDPRVWSGAPILTQWRDWAYRDPWSALMSYQPREGDEIGFFLVAGDRRSPHNIGPVRERTNVARVKLAANGVADALAPVGVVTPPVVVPPVVTPSEPNPGYADLKAEVNGLTEALAKLVDRVTEVEAKALALQVKTTTTDEKLAALSTDVANEKKKVTDALAMLTRGGLLSSLFGRK